MNIVFTSNHTLVQLGCILLLDSDTHLWTHGAFSVSVIVNTMENKSLLLDEMLVFCSHLLAYLDIISAF